MSDSDVERLDGGHDRISGAESYASGTPVHSSWRPLQDDHTAATFGSGSSTRHAILTPFLLDMNNSFIEDDEDDEESEPIARWLSYHDAPWSPEHAILGETMHHRELRLKEVLDTVDRLFAPPQWT